VASSNVSGVIAAAVIGDYDFIFALVVLILQGLKAFSDESLFI
jgi:hypothetical protein